MQINFYFIAFGEELIGLFRANFQIVQRGSDADSYAFYLNVFLLFCRLPPLFFFGIKILPAVGNFGDRRFSGWRNFNKVQPGFYRQPQGFGEGQNAQVFAFLVDYPKLGRGYLIIDSYSLDRSILANF